MRLVFQKASKLTREYRRSICNKCPNQRSKFSLFGIPLLPTKQCSECKCIIKAKTALKNEECPIGKW